MKVVFWFGSMVVFYRLFFTEKWTAIFGLVQWLCIFLWICWKQFWGEDNVAVCMNLFWKCLWWWKLKQGFFLGSPPPVPSLYFVNCLMPSLYYQLACSFWLAFYVKILDIDLRVIVLSLLLNLICQLYAMPILVGPVACFETVLVLGFCTLLLADFDFACWPFLLLYLCSTMFILLLWTKQAFIFVWYLQ